MVLDMLNLFKKREKTVNETFEERLINIENQIKQQKRDILDLYTDIDAIRNKVLKKIQTRRIQEEETEEESVKKTGILYQR